MGASPACVKGSYVVPDSGTTDWDVLESGMDTASWFYNGWKIV